MEIFICQNLKALPNGLRNLTSLQYLLIQDCPSIGSFTANCFPTNLTSVRIDYEKIYKPLILERGPGLHRFTSLRQLTLFGGECCSVVSFPLEKDTGKALPASLKHLSIWNFPNLERISSIENLTSFESLQLCCCPKLQEFPDNGLPTSLLRLEIYGCPLIEERFEKDKGQYWSLIAEIPCVRIDCHYVIDPKAQRQLIQTGDYTIPHSSAHFFPYQLIKVGTAKYSTPVLSLRAPLNSGLRQSYWRAPPSTTTVEFITFLLDCLYHSEAKIDVNSDHIKCGEDLKSNLKLRGKKEKEPQ
ncbi:hypothetical protein CUMW_267320, partial [Citrus unshiu]